MGLLGRISGWVLLLALAGAGVTVFAPAAEAKSCFKNLAPPGHAGSSQYFETVPTSCGNAVPPSTGTGSGADAGSITQLGHGRAGIRGLSHLGTSGKAAAALAAATAPSSGGAGSSSPPDGGASKRGTTHKLFSSPAVESSSGSAGAALGSALTGSDPTGLGVLLPVLLGLTLVGAIVAGVLGARSGGGSSA